MIYPHMIRPSWCFPYNRDMTLVTISTIPLLHLFLDEDLDAVVFGSSALRHWRLRIPYQRCRRQECLSTSADRSAQQSLSEDNGGVDCSFCFVATGLAVSVVISSEWLDFSFSSGSSLAYLFISLLMTIQEWDPSFSMESFLISIPYWYKWYASLISNTRSIFVCPRIHPFGVDLSSSRSDVFSRHEPTYPNPNNSMSSTVMKYCPREISHKNEEDDSIYEPFKLNPVLFYRLSDLSEQLQCCLCVLGNFPFELNWSSVDTIQFIIFMGLREQLNLFLPYFNWLRMLMNFAKTTYRIRVNVYPLLSIAGRLRPQAK